MMIFRLLSQLFIKRKSGSVPIVVALALIPMLVAVGGSIDLVAHEKIRLALQDALDRGVLAAASLTQSQDATALVKSYVKLVPNSKFASVTVADVKKANFRQVTATAEITYETSFLQLASIKSLKVSAKSTAQEAKSNIELSLVLDISGSMYDNGGIVQLRPAAKQFLDIVLKDDVRDVTSVSIVPFAGTVNLGYDVFNYLTGFEPVDKSKSSRDQAIASGVCTASPTPIYTRKHCFTSCLDALSTDFNAGKPVFSLRSQLSHFTYYNYNTTGKKPWWCPTEDAAITYLTNDISYLKTKIDALQPFDGTGTAYGMKWAELLLNPSMQSVISNLSVKGIAPIPASFRNRPALYTDADTMKFIVLMTDGQIGFQPRPTSMTNPAFNGKNISPGGQNTVQYSESQSIDFYKRVCTYSKQQGIKIFTIAFKVSASVAATIATCASDPSYAFKVDGLDMASAFQSIATSMQKLRLVR